MTDEERVEYDRWVTQVRGALAEAECEAAWAEGRGMAMDRAVRFAVEQGKI
jgi:hypothetical protein